MEKQITDYRNILVSRTDNLGDVILTLPLLSEIKKHNKKARITFLVKRYVENLLRNYEDIDELMIIDDYSGILSLSKLIKSKSFDLSICVYPRFSVALAMRIAGIKTRIGSGYRWYSFLFNEKVFEHRKDAVNHEADYNKNLLTPVCNSISRGYDFKFRYDNSEKIMLFEKLSNFKIDISQKYVIVHPGSKGSAINFPASGFSGIVDFLCKMNKASIVFTGVESENEQIKNIIVQSGCDSSKIINLAGKLNLRELMIFIDNSSLFISNSTGPLHIAGALNKKIIAFYPNSAPMNKTRWKPLSNDTLIFTPPNESDDMDLINIDEVCEAMRNLI
ncbi:lipopolysaccharide heptosyltransferase family protein [bacterium]|nr:MAG: lipopolysaccharide heptosyltransferase family protein [bacterium]